MSFLSLWIGKRFPPFQFVEMQCALEKITLKVGWAPSIQIGDQSIVPLFHFTSFCLQCRRLECNPWIGKIPWRREWLPLPVLLPGESRGQRSLAGYSPWGRKRVQHNWATNTFTFTFSYFRFIWGHLLALSIIMVGFAFMLNCSAAQLLMAHGL